MGDLGTWGLGVLRRSTHPALAGTPPRRGFSALGFDRHLFRQLFGEFDMSGKQKEGKGDADGDEAGEDEVEPDVANADTLAFYDHKH